jgi:rhodanese-related sulfurtransferase
MMEMSEQFIAVNDLERLLKEDETATLIDARTAEEFAEGHVPGAINVAIGELTEFAKSLGNASEGLVVTMCGSAGRGEKAAAILNSCGVENIMVLKGGLRAWKDADLPVA